MPRPRGCQGRQARIDSVELVPVEPMREQYLRLRERGLITMGDVCIHMGWVYRPSPGRLRAERRREGVIRPDYSRARRELGLERRQDCQGPREYLGYDTALRLSQILGLDPHEAGL